MTIQTCSVRLASCAGILLALTALTPAQTGPSSVLYDYTGASADHLGGAVAEIGDVDGDTRADYAVGAVGANNWRGQVRVFSGSRGTLIFALDGIAAGDRFGHSIAALPDLNGDGIDDFAVGAPLATGATLGCGKVYVCSGLDGTTIFVREGAGAQDHMGWSVASLGDVNSDGVGDVAGGAIDDDNFGSSSGSVRVWSGASSATLFNVYGFQSNQLFGSSLVDVGDRNNDGVPDFAVGAPSNSGSASTGYVRIFSGFDQSVLATINGLNSGDNFGYSIAAIGDLDNDGRTDLAIGSPQISPASTGQADVYLAAGNSFLFRVFGTGTGDRFATSLSAAGDVNQDGTADFVVGAPRADLPTAVDCGSLTIYSGSNGAQLLRHFGADVGMPVGASVAGASDVNEDGRPDIVAGSPGNLAAAFDTGGALVLSTQPLTFWATDFVVSAALPASPTLTIDLGNGYAGMNYLVLGSITGLAPKTLVGGVMVPLALDRYFRHTIAAPTNALLQGSSGQLDLNGQAQVTFTPSAALQSPAYYGLTFYHAALVLDAQGQPLMASNPLPVTLVP